MKATAVARRLTCIILAWGIFVIPLTAAPETVELKRKPRPVTRPDHSPGYEPWNRDLEMNESKDSLRFVRRGTFVERGGVPDLAGAKDGKLFAYFQWFPLDRTDDFDKIAVMISEGGGRDILTYEMMMNILAGLLGKKRLFVPSPVSNIGLFSCVTGFITTVPPGSPGT